MSELNLKNAISNNFNVFSLYQAAVSGEDYNVHISSSGSWQSEMSGSPSDQSSASSSPHSPDKRESTEMNPSMYEQINLGINGQGFKRFKWNGSFEPKSKHKDLHEGV